MAVYDLHQPQGYQVMCVTSTALWRLWLSHCLDASLRCVDLPWCCSSQEGRRTGHETAWCPGVAGWLRVVVEPRGEGSGWQAVVREVMSACVGMLQVPSWPWQIRRRLLGRLAYTIFQPFVPVRLGRTTWWVTSGQTMVRTRRKSQTDSC